MGCNRWKDRSINARIAKAKFPQIKTIEEFDFSFQPSIPEAFIKEWGEKEELKDIAIF